ncbi:hypothetical protein QJQ45_026065 [Haematococcus lacustris]|nr:hypothetical protein QJQ45_026065 [Haematococcus lacustris]
MESMSPPGKGRHVGKMMQCTASVWVLLVVVAALAAPTRAMFEDQAGTFDWYKSFVGHVLSGSFHAVKPRLYLGTEQGVAAALNLRDGSIAWRHKLPDADAPRTTLLLDNPALFVTLSGGKLRAWDQTEGVLRWEADADTHQASYPSALAASSGAKQTIGVFIGSQIKTFSAVSGDELASLHAQDLSPLTATRLLQATAGTGFTGYSYEAGSTTVNMHMTDGSSIRNTQASLPQPLSSIAVSAAWGMAALSADGSSVCTIDIRSQPDLHSTCTPLAAFEADSVGVERGSTVQLVATASGLALASGSPKLPGVLLMALPAGDQGSASGQLTLTKAFPDASAVSQAAEAAAGQVVALVEVNQQGSVVVQYASTATGTILASDGSVKGSSIGVDKLAAGASPPGMRAALLGVFKKKDGSDGFRVLLVWADERIALLQQGVTVWARDEALAGVTNALFTDLPSAVAKGEAEGMDFNTFFKLQLLGFKVQTKMASREEVTEYTDLRARLSDKNLPTRDTRGFRRALVVTTASGKVAALHNGDGRVLWSRPGSADTAPQHLLAWRSFHDLTHAPLLATLHSSPASDVTVLSVYDAHTGAQTSAVLDYRVDKLVPLGKVAVGDHAEQSLFLAVSLPQPGAAEGALPQVHLLPDSDLARHHFKQHYRSTFFWLDHSGPTNTLLQGYGFDSVAVAALTSAAGGAATAVPVWSLALPEARLAVQGRRPEEPVYTAVKVLGDRSMKYRQLSPNLLLVVTGHAAAAQVPRDELDFLAAHILLVDAVTGAVLHRQSAPGCRGPALALMSENLGVVQLWDAASSRFTLTSLELFDASERQFSLLDTLFNPNATQPTSSFNPPPLEVLTASFFQRLPAKGLASTMTREGITSRMLLSLTTSDQVYALDMRFLDPRRPRRAKLTAEEQEERLLPYSDTLPLNAPSFVSYNKQVLGLRGLISTASRLESTTLLFSWGVDLQFTRLAPAKGFDSLDDDFNYGLLVVALVALGVASVFMHWYTKSAILKSKWQ